MIRYSVKADVKKATRYLTNVQKRQVPFATANAINNTLFDMRGNLVKRLIKDIDRPTPFTQKGFTVNKAKKTKLRGEVFIQPNRMKYLQYAIFGGTRRPNRKVIIIGTKKRNQYGNTPGMRNLRNKLLNQKNVFEGESRGGTAGIWKRTKGETQLLARYVTRANYQKRFKFFDTARKTANARFPINFNRQLARALRSAR